MVSISTEVISVVTYLTCPTHGFLRFIRHAMSRAKFRCNPIGKEELLKLSIWEAIGQIANKTVGQPHQGVGALFVSQAAMYQLQHVLRMGCQKRHCEYVLVYFQSIKS